jgi:hypothetical protein
MPDTTGTSTSWQLCPGSKDNFLLIDSCGAVLLFGLWHDSTGNQGRGCASFREILLLRENLGKIFLLAVLPSLLEFAHWLPKLPTLIF